MDPIRLGVNIDHVATLRNARGGSFPDPIEAAKIAKKSGADGITAHLREDRRHIKDDDINRLVNEVDLPLNFEMAATKEMLNIASVFKPHAACIVPEKRQEITTEGGLDVVGQSDRLREICDELANMGSRVSLFIEADEAQIMAAAELGVPVIEIHAGAGGTESQDWAEMLYRMYSMWAESKGFKFNVIDFQNGDEAGLKDCTVEISGDYAYGLLQAEIGIHRLVRISPFDSNSRRHTSFASVSVSPAVNEDIDIEINQKDLRVDTFRSSGAGGQHVNKTDSAIRITHIPSGIVTQCQTQRSQHKNKEQALKVLKSKLFQLEMEKQLLNKKELEGEKKDIGWGSQIRSYVFHPYNMIKDNRTKHEVGNIKSVMDGNIDDFIYSYLLDKMEKNK